MWTPSPARTRATAMPVSRLYGVGSLLLHAALAGLMLALPGLGAVQQARSAAAEAAAVERRLQDTETRALRQRVNELEEIRREMAALAGQADAEQAAPAASAAASPADLATRAQALSKAIEAAERRVRAAELSRLTGVSPEQAARQLAAESQARPPVAAASSPRAETAPQQIARLQQQARQVLQRAQATRAAATQGSRLTPAASASAAPGGRWALPSTLQGRKIALGRGRGGEGTPGGGERGQAREGPAGRTLGSAEVAAGSRKEPGFALLELGEPSGRGLSANPGSPVKPGGTARGDRHELVAAAGPAGGDRPGGPGAGGRSIGAGGVYAERVYLDSWYVIGPFEGQGTQSMERVYPPEDGVDLEASYRGLDGRLLGWRYASRGFYPFVPPDRAENAVYYAYTELRVAQEQELWLSFASDDDLKVWLDGQLVWHSSPGIKAWYRTPFYFAHEQAASMAMAEGSRKVRLAPGVHRLLVKLYNDYNHTFFSIVLTP